VVPSIFCKAKTCRKHRRYQKRKSLTGEDIDLDGSVVKPQTMRDQMKVSFGTGEITGVFMRDDLCAGGPVGGTAGTSLIQRNNTHVQKTVVAQASQPNASEVSPGPEKAGLAERAASRDPCFNVRFIAATQMSDDPFEGFGFDGVVGLGLPSLSQSPEFNFVETAAGSGLWGAPSATERMFALSLTSSVEGESEITFGGWLPERISPGEDIAWCSVRDNQEGYWQLDVFAIRAGGVELAYCDPGEGCRAIVDSGTSLLAMPTELGMELGDLLRHKASGPGGKCGGPGPELEIDLGNITVVLGPSEYARPENVPDEKDPVSSAAPASQDDNYCVPMLMYVDFPEPLPPKMMILGEIVLQKYYTIFNAGAPPTVGFARALHHAPRAAVM